LKINGQKDLDIVSNECGIKDWGLAILLENN
jgi:acyl CoA:acetate/3-ketoacid CoA transferase alpha subunit